MTPAGTAPRSPRKGTTRGNSVDTLLGTRLGGFRLLSVLGLGGMSTVYRAKDPTLHREVAVKVLSPQLSTQEAFTSRFLRESQVAGALDHPHIVPVHSAGEDRGLLFIAMGLVEGTDFGAMLQAEGALPISRALQILGPVASALDHAHERGVIHRDVKPANILIRKRDGHVFLTDFGVTKLVSGSRYTETGELIGSITYMSPEQIEGQEVDARSDVYALGCVLFEAVTGTPPFHGDSEAAVLWSHLKGNVPSVRQSLPLAPAKADAAIAAALSRRPDERYPSCRDLIESVDAALDGRRLPALARAAGRSGTARFVARRLRRYAEATRRFVRVAATLSLAAAIAIPGSLLLARATGLIGTDPSEVAELPPQEDPDAEGVAAEAMDKNMGRTQGDRERARTPSRGTKRHESPARSGRSPSPSAGIDDTGQLLDEAVPKSQGDVNEVQPGQPRVVQLTYDGPSEGDIIPLDGACGGSDSTGCISTQARSDERYLNLKIEDRSGSEVVGWIRQDIDGDGGFDGEWIQVCGETTEPVRIHAGAVIDILIDDRDCPSDGAANVTEGVLTLSFHTKLPKRAP